MQMFWWYVELRVQYVVVKTFQQGWTQSNRVLMGPTASTEPYLLVFHKHPWYTYVFNSVEFSCKTIKHFEVM